MSEFYDEIERQFEQCCNPRDILVLGCGTGLEIERIRYAANVTAVDISSKMLKQLQKKELSHLNLITLCASILEIDFGNDKYDLVLSCYTMHHFNEFQRIKIYQKIFNCLKSNGVFLHGDSMAITVEEEQMKLLEAEKIYREENLPFGSLHIDVPFTLGREFSINRRVGFNQLTLEKEWTRTKLYKAVKFNMIGQI